MQRQLKSGLRSIAATLVAGILLPTAGYAETDASTASGWRHYTAAAFDAVVIRPMGAVALVVGGAYVIPVVLLTWPSGQGTIDVAVDRFVARPAKNLLERPLGDF